MKFLTIAMILLSLSACATTDAPQVANTRTPATSVSQTPNQTAEAKPTPPKEVFEILESLKSLEQQGNSMQKLRDKSDIASVSECGDLMRKRMAAAKELQAKIEKLPNPFSFLLGVPAGEGAQCVTCGRGAKDSCARMKTDIAFAEKRILEN